MMVDMKDKNFVGIGITGFIPEDKHKALALLLKTMEEYNG